jgi:hypothetical protein
MGVKLEVLTSTNMQHNLSYNNIQISVTGAESLDLLGRRVLKRK